MYDQYGVNMYKRTINIFDSKIDQQLFPRNGFVNTPFHGSIAILQPNEITMAHKHIQEEIWLILSGKGKLTIENETSELYRGEMIYIPAKKIHQIQNVSHKNKLIFLALWW